MSLKSNIGPFRYGIPPEVPKERILREIEDVKNMVCEWKNSYVRIVREVGPYDMAVSEFWGEIEEFVMPWLNRMWTIGFVTDEELEEIMNYFRSLVIELEDEINSLKEGKDA